MLFSDTVETCSEAGIIVALFAILNKEKQHLKNIEIAEFFGAPKEHRRVRTGAQDRDQCHEHSVHKDDFLCVT